MCPGSTDTLSRILRSARHYPRKGHPMLSHRAALKFNALDESATDGCYNFKQVHTKCDPPESVAGRV